MHLLAYGNAVLSTWISSIALIGGVPPVALLQSSVISISHFELLLVLSRSVSAPVRDDLLCIDIGVTADILWLSAFPVIAFWAAVIARRTRCGFCFLGSGVAWARQPRLVGGFNTRHMDTMAYPPALVDRSGLSDSLASKRRATKGWGVEGLGPSNTHIYGYTGEGYGGWRACTRKEKSANKRLRGRLEKGNWRTRAFVSRISGHCRAAIATCSWGCTLCLETSSRKRACRGTYKS